MIEGPKGTGKTEFVKALSQLLGGTFNRAQMTPETMPTDLTGMSIYDRQKGQTVFKPGPVFSRFFLVDEINRALSKTQSGHG